MTGERKKRSARTSKQENNYSFDNGLQACVKLGQNFRCTIGIILNRWTSAKTNNEIKK